uniref:EGF-like domain-containing protein n=1 Tax=Macrostomum lignano TaxID=282301 RepID=A0A1I8J992_9PLAT
MGWSGRRCRKPLCRPQCRNGGACVGPNLCACAAGFSGTQCQTVHVPLLPASADCYPPCVNGGTCIRPGKCSCPPGYRGRFCHRVRCHRSLCLNGGRCIESDGLCRCRAGFYGARCQRRNCTPELSYRKTYRPVVKRLRKPTVQPCSPGSKRYCLLNSLSKVVVFKIILRPYFTCSST